MLLFPENIKVTYPFNFSSKYKTQISTFRSGKEQRRARRDFPRREGVLNILIGIGGYGLIYLTLQSERLTL